MPLGQCGLLELGDAIGTGLTSKCIFDIYIYMGISEPRKKPC